MSWNLFSLHLFFVVVFCFFCPWDFSAFFTVRHISSISLQLQQTDLLVGGGGSQDTLLGWMERMEETKAPSSKIQVDFSRQKWLDGLRECR